ncbi:hypothetical protein, partial [Bacillus cereus group sp. BC329]|uniref:hypothetical protein n=1 Tax=Bacillus cereus group sp. BC329 TaxID=3445307 RepID=UPI003F25C558
VLDAGVVAGDAIFQAALVGGGFWRRRARRRSMGWLLQREEVLTISITPTIPRVLQSASQAWSDSG